MKKLLMFVGAILICSTAHSGRYDGLTEIFNKAAKKIEDFPTYQPKPKPKPPGMGGSQIGSNPPQSTAIPYNGNWSVKPLTPPPKFDGSSVKDTFNYNAR